MKAIKTSIWYLLIYNKLFLGILVIFAILTMAINITGQKNIIEAIGLILQLFVFLGVYLGGSIAKLKQNYLWRNNKNYKNSILHAYLLIIVILNLSFIPFIWDFKSFSPFILFIPMCVSIFASQMVLLKNIIFKILIPAIPFGIYKLTQFGLGMSTALLLIVIVTIILLISMYKNIFYHYSELKTTSGQEKANSIAFMTTGLNHKHLSQLNGFIGGVISNWILYGKRNVDWAVLMPHSRLTLMTLFYILPFLFFLTMSGDKMQKVMGVFALFLLPNLFLGLVMESKNILKQTRVFAHVFGGDNHRKLKNKILF